MKRTILLSLGALFFNFSNAQSIIDTVTTGAAYTNQIWYSLANDEQGSAPKDNWDIAFEINGYSASILANTQKSLVLYQSPYKISDWAMLDTAGIATWQQLYNSDADWAAGAFNTNLTSDDYDLGWGVYDLNTHYVLGDSVYVIRLANGTFKKFRLDQLASGKYFFTWADLDGGNEQTDSLVKTNFTGKNFGYFSLENGITLDREPATSDWDLTFTKYTTILYTPAPMPYPVTGVLLNKGIEAIKALAVNVNTVDYHAFTFQDAANTIGYDWKSFNGSAYVLDDSVAYFVKTSAGAIWKMVFTGFGGSASGEYIFSKELIAAAPDTTTGIAPSQGLATFAVYPNPAHNELTVLYNNINGALQQTVLNMYDLSGRLVLSENLPLLDGFNQYPVNISSIEPGIYIVAIPNLGIQQKVVVE